MRALIALADFSDAALRVARPTLALAAGVGSVVLVVWLLWRWDQRESP